LKKTTGKQVTKAKRAPAKTRRPAARGPSTPGAASVADFYAHAIAIEREAAENYRELAAQMRNLGNQEIAALFERLAKMEKLHALGLQTRAKGMKLPRLPAKAHAWLDAGPTEVPRYELLFSGVQRHHVLLLALRAERHAKEYFERIGRRSDKMEIRRLAAELAADEAEHISWIELAIEREPQPAVEDDFA
jgi:rubrerythrin